jgi:ADP-heptose:LPS heptosyltransferase/predicted SAM-dependent methyltransferase
MTWIPDPARNRAYEEGESAKCRWDIVQYTRGCGLELGCGPQRAFPHFIGIDANQYPGARMGPNLQMDCSHLGSLADRGFDFVFSSHLLEHLADTRAVLREWWRVIDVGGHLVLYLPHKEYYPNIGEPGGNPDHKHDFLPVDIVDAMRAVAPDWDLLENESRNGGDEYSFFQVYRKLPEGRGQAETWKAPRPEKCAAVMRPGAYGDVLWSSSVAWHLKHQGYHVTLYTEANAAEVMRHDPNIDRIIFTTRDQVPLGFLSAYYASEAKKYDRTANLLESVERNALAWPTDTRFLWPDKVRRRIFGGNYLELLHDLADVPHEFHQRFYATDAERLEAEYWQRAHCGTEPMVVVAPSGSTPPKFWPHLQSFVAQLAAAQIHAVVLGDLRGMKLETSPHVHAVGMEWPIRRAITLALQADVVIGQETALLNAVAMEPMRKIVMLSHSTPENLTKHWINTSSIESKVPCYPCHRIHLTFEHCVRDPASGTAACQAAISAEEVLSQVMVEVKRRAVAA